LTVHYSDDRVTLHHGDCPDVLLTLPDNSVDCCVTDPPYDLTSGKRGGTGVASLNLNSPAGRSRISTGGFMGQHWDATGVAFDPETWRRVYRVLKPGGYLLAFGGTRTSHRLACAIEDAGFEIRDSIAWLYGQGFAKSLNIDNIAPGKSPFCQCWKVDSPYGSGSVEQGSSADMSGLPNRVLPGPVQEARQSPPGMLATVQREAGRRPSSDSSEVGVEGLDNWTSAALRAGQSSLEGRGNAETVEGQLQGRSVRPLSPRVACDGARGRLHHGTPSSDGAVGRPTADPSGMREPHQPESLGQSTGEPRVVPDERGSQAGRGWPVCAGCGKPVVPRGLGTALKPAHEPIIVARKPLQGTVSANVQRWGTGALNIDACRIDTNGETWAGNEKNAHTEYSGKVFGTFATQYAKPSNPGGRWPANVVLDESQAEALDQIGMSQHGSGTNTIYGSYERSEQSLVMDGTADSGGASRFFYTAKASTDERIRHDGVAHPTVKPLSLMRWLVKLVTPLGGVVLEPFAGSGTTVEACILEGFKCVAIEREAEYLPLITQRINRRLDPIAYLAASGDDMGLFGDDAG
jgi:DNA modification methylase